MAKGITTVTEPRGSDERLAEAFRALGDTHGTEVPEDLRERIWLAVSGDLPPEERRELVERTVTDPGMRRGLARRERVVAGVAGLRGWWGRVARLGLAARWAPRWLAAAAVLLLGTTIGVVSLLNPPPGDEFRASSGCVVESLVPADVALPRDAFRLRWTPGPEGSRYQVRVTTEDLQVLATAADLTAPEFVVEPAVLAGCPVEPACSGRWMCRSRTANGSRLQRSSHGWSEGNRARRRSIGEDERFHAHVEKEPRPCSKPSR